jgi:hypothetical protein
MILFGAGIYFFTYFMELNESNPNKTPHIWASAGTPGIVGTGVGGTGAREGSTQG